MKKSLTLATALVFVSMPAFANKAEFFNKIDSNNDGYISREENAAHANSSFQKADTNNDGKLSRDEVTTHYGKMRQKHATRSGSQQAPRAESQHLPQNMDENIKDMKPASR